MSVFGDNIIVDRVLELSRCDLIPEAHKQVEQRPHEFGEMQQDPANKPAIEGFEAPPPREEALR